jgi:hypothetical protein
MKLPPLVMYMKVGDKQDQPHGGISLWIPLFILVPIALIMMLALLLIALPFMLIFTLLTWNANLWRWIFRGIPLLFNTLHELRGSNVEVEDGKKYVTIDVE